MGGPTEEEFLAVLDEALELLKESGHPHAVIGGIATTALLDSGWNVKRADLDFLVRTSDADEILESFREQGFAVWKKDPSWLYKAARPDVTLDVIFKSSGNIELDEDFISSLQIHEFEKRKLPTPCPEDLLTTKVLAHKEEAPGHWFDSLELLRKYDFDWEYLLTRAKKHGAKRMLSFLLYAQTDEIAVPDSLIDRLRESV